MPERLPAAGHILQRRSGLPYRFLKYLQWIAVNEPACVTKSLSRSRGLQRTESVRVRMRQPPLRPQHSARTLPPYLPSAPHMPTLAREISPSPVDKTAIAGPLASSGADRRRLPSPDRLARIESA